MATRRVTHQTLVFLTVGSVVCIGILTTGLLVTSTWSGSPIASVTDAENVSEAAYVEEAPEPGDDYYEARAADGSWISYVNPRDEYRDPYLGDGSGKLCVVLLNEAGDPIVGETVPETTVTVPTGDSLEWHTQADPMVVEYPLTDHYERPLDADQFGTSADVVQGDGYMDTHCIEFHGLPEDGEIEYGEASIEGEYADYIDVVGYIQQDNRAWDTDVDPLEDAVSYEEAGGGWTYQEPRSHGQAVVVAQLNATVTGVDETSNSSVEQPERENSSVDTQSTSTETDGVVEATDDLENSTTDQDVENSTVDREREDELPGFTTVPAIGILIVTVLVIGRRR